MQSSEYLWNSGNEIPRYSETERRYVKKAGLVKSDTYMVVERGGGVWWEGGSLMSVRREKVLTPFGLDFVYRF